ncbi:MAG: SOS response-associated peptidase [Aggregatilineales bacterium]
MCGRYTLTTDSSTLQKTFNLDELPEVEIQARYNIAPTQPVSVITSARPRQLTFMQWGLVPSWAKDPSIGHKMINARSETVHEKPSFRSAFKRRRCIIPADGFYEWKKEGKVKKPQFIHMKNRAVFGLAGLWETWQSPHGDELITCTILTTEPNDLVKPLHHRMAVILPSDHYDTWLNTDSDAPELKALFDPYPPDDMRAYEVSTMVNSPRNEGPDLIVPYEAPRQGTLL